MRKASKKADVEKSSMNGYERSRVLRVQVNRSREIGVKDIATSLISLADSHKMTNKRKKLLATSDTVAEYAQNLDSVGDGHDSAGSSKETTVASQKGKNKKQKLLVTSDTAAEYAQNSDSGGDGHDDEGSFMDVRFPKKKCVDSNKEHLGATPKGKKLQLGTHVKAGHEHTHQVVDDHNARKKLEMNVNTVGEMFSHKKQLQPRKDTRQWNSEGVLYDIPSNSSVSRPKLSLVTSDSFAKGANLTDIEIDDEELYRIVNEISTKNTNGNDGEPETMNVDDQSVSSEDASTDMDDQSASSEDEDDELSEELLNLQSQREAEDGLEKRGSTMMHHVDIHESDKRKVIICNEFGQPVGPVTAKENILGKFSRFLGTIGRNYDYAPLIYESWHKVPHKDKMWEYVLEKYIVPDLAKKWVLKSICAAWRGHKCRVKRTHFHAYNDNQTRWDHRPRKIPENDFMKLLGLWNKKEVKKRSSAARDRGKSQRNRHTVGPKSYARVQEEMKNENPDKEPPSIAQLFERTRQRKEGKQYADPQDDDIAGKIEAIKNYKPPEGCSDADAFLAVMGKEYNGLRRLYGKGVTNRILKKGNGTETSYMVSREVFESLTTAAELEKSYQRHKAEMEQLRREIEAHHERQRLVFEEMRRNFETQRDKIVEDVVRKVLARISPEIARKPPEITRESPEITREYLS